MIDFVAAAAQNRRRTRWLVAGLVALAIAIGLALDASLRASAPVCTLLALGIATALAWLSVVWGDRMVLASLGAELVDLTALDDPERRQLVNVVREVAVASGLPLPRVWVIPDDTPNALATGRDPAHASIAVTRGLLVQLDRAQTQGVVAHEMGHIRNLDTRLGVMVAVLVGAVALLGDTAYRLRFLQRRTRSDDRGAGLLVWVVLLVLSMLGPIAARLIAFAISRQREFLADATAVEFTRNPLALAGALEVIGAMRAPSPLAYRGTAHLFFASPRSSWADDRKGVIADLWATHPPVDERIRRLRGMSARYGQSVARSGDGVPSETPNGEPERDG